MFYSFIFFRTNMCRDSAVFPAMAAMEKYCLDRLVCGDPAASLPDSPPHSHQGHCPQAAFNPVTEHSREDQRERVPAPCEMTLPCKPR